MSFQDYVDELDKSEARPNYRNIALVGAAIVLVIGVVFALMGYLNSAEASSFEVTKADDAAERSDDGMESVAEPASVQVCVYVTGHVVHPGVVYLDEGSRVADAIEACGGMTDDASAESLNLARIVADGEQIQVQSVAEMEAASQTVVPSGSSASVASGPSSQVASGPSSQVASGKVNINTADSSQLQTLSGVGESKAKKIIDYREANGPFKSIEDLANVSGIGEKTVENLREYICI